MLLSASDYSNIFSKGLSFSWWKHETTYFICKFDSIINNIVFFSMVLPTDVGCLIPHYKESEAWDPTTSNITTYVVVRISYLHTSYDASNFPALPWQLHAHCHTMSQVRSELSYCHRRQDSMWNTFVYESRSYTLVKRDVLPARMCRCDGDCCSPLVRASRLTAWAGRRRSPVN